MAVALHGLCTVKQYFATQNRHVFHSALSAVIHIVFKSLVALSLLRTKVIHVLPIRIS